MFDWFKKMFGSRAKGGRIPEPHHPDDNVLVRLGDDPLDPRGDGTLREGDPMYEVFMQMINGRSGPIIANRIGDTEEWNVQYSKPDGEEDE